MISLQEYLNNLVLPTENVIYGLCEPDSENVRYIGKANNLIKRIKNHYKPSKLSGNTHKNNWLKLLLNNGFRPTIIILEECSDYNSLNISEIKWIEHYKSSGYDLTNGTYTGDGFETTKDINKFLSALGEK